LSSLLVSVKVIDTSEVVGTLTEWVQTVEQKVQLFAIHSSVEQYLQEHPVFRYSAAEMVVSIGVGQESDYELDSVLERFERSASPDLHSDPEDILEQALA